ncbi:hypothetical protein [Tenacibaculum soleae]|uniref:hypothetical protein n=1 Tax=Tenacibaculum soleae TaxID=447689 RepID=UPI002300D633|nr:hypothetical protein [Tenacibaculum soleae]
MTTTQIAYMGGFGDLGNFGSSGNFNGNTSTPVFGNYPTTTSFGGGNKFESTMVGGVLGTLLSNGGNIAQIISAVNGNAPTMQDPKGNTHDITAVRAEIAKISAEKNQDMNTVLQMMVAQLNKEKNETPPPPPKDNTALYIGLGVGALVLLGGVFYITNSKK